MSWPKIVVVNHLLLFYTTTKNHFSIGLWHATKRGLYTKHWQCLDQAEAPKHFPKPYLHQEKAMVTGGLLLVWSTIAFWILVKWSHLRSTLSKSMRRTENRQPLQLALINRKGPILLHNTGFRSGTHWVTKLCLICHIHLTPCQPTNHFFKQLDKFLQGNCFHNQEEAENAF